MPVVIFEPISKRIEMDEGETLYVAVQRLGHAISAACGGAGTCGKCRVIVAEGADLLSPVTDVEHKFLSVELLAKGYRLACQTRVLGDIRVMIPPESLEKKGRILVEGRRVDIALDALSKKILVVPPKPDLASITGDVERLLGPPERPSILIPHPLMQSIPLTMRVNPEGVTLTFIDAQNQHHGRLLQVQPGDTIRDHYGFAVDIGTTTVVGYLVNLQTGVIVSNSSMLNPQVAFGEDVITRMTHAQDPAGARQLNRAILDCVTFLCEDACLLAGVNIGNVHEVHIVGNTAMHHLFLNLPTNFLGLSPFPPVVQHSTSYLGAEIGLRNLEHANVFVLPVIAGFVGADTVGVILAGDLDELDEFTLTIDIGTNGELVLGNKQEGLTAGSCAAGSALEGAHIASGMRAAGGAIEKVRIDPETLEVSYQTINDEQPVGICGSGILDTVAEMIRAGVIAQSGKIHPKLAESPRTRIREGPEGLEFVVAFEEETTTGNAITFSQEDVRELQKAKAAFYAGAKLLLLQASKTPEAIEQLLLAGAFGSYLDKRNLHFIGMIPDVPLDKIHQIGNAAGIGCQYSLLNRSYRKKSDRVARNADYVELTTRSEFTREYAMAMYFPHFKIDQEFPSLVDQYKEIPRR